MRERLQDLLQSCWPDADIVANLSTTINDGDGEEVGFGVDEALETPGGGDGLVDHVAGAEIGTGMGAVGAVMTIFVHGFRSQFG